MPVIYELFHVAIRTNSLASDSRIGIERVASGLPGGGWACGFVVFHGSRRRVSRFRIRGLRFRG